MAHPAPPVEPRDESAPPDPSQARPDPDPPVDAEALADAETIRRIRALPPEIGALLLSVGVLGVVLPGVLGTPALVAGGLALWPRGFRKVDDWLGRRFPTVHHQGMRQLDRFLDDLERRYPYRRGGGEAPPDPRP